jgi:hypothetical protein
MPHSKRVQCTLRTLHFLFDGDGATATHDLIYKYACVVIMLIYSCARLEAH